MTAQPDQIPSERKAQILKCTADSKEDLPNLVNCLVAGTDDSREKLWRMIYWVAENIAYDVAKFGAGSTTALDDVLQSKKGVCSDYAKLFRDMCREAAIDCSVVEGYVKGWGYNEEKGFLQPNHAWNAIRLPDTTLLLDLTWATGEVNAALNFTKTFDEAWIFVDPEVLILTHLPADPRWQLTASPVSLRRFEASANHAEMTAGLTATFAYQDSLATYWQSDEHDRMVRSGQSAYAFNPTDENLYRWLTNILHHCNLIWQNAPRREDYQRTINYSQLVQRKARELPRFAKRKYFMEQAALSIKYARYMLDSY